MKTKVFKVPPSTPEQEGSLKAHPAGNLLWCLGLLGLSLIINQIIKRFYFIQLLFLWNSGASTAPKIYIGDDTP